MKVLIADSQSKVRNALCVLLRQQAGLEIAGEATTASELLARVVDLQPDLVLLHWRLRGATGQELLADLRESCPGLRILVLSVRPESCGEALAAGADAFVSKMDQPEKLLAAIRCIRKDVDAGSEFKKDHQGAGIATASTDPGCPGEPISDQARRGAPPRSLAATAPATR